MVPAWLHKISRFGNACKVVEKIFLIDSLTLKNMEQHSQTHCRPRRLITSGVVAFFPSLQFGNFTSEKHRARRQSELAAAIKQQQECVLLWMCFLDAA